MFPSQGTIALILGRSSRRVQDRLKELVDAGHIVFAGWVRLNSHPGSRANVKSYRWNLWDQRVEQRFDQDLLGIRRSGRKCPDQTADAPRQHRKKTSGAKSLAQPRSGRSASSGPDDSGGLVRTPTSYKLSEEPSDRTEEAADAFKAFKEAAKRLGIAIKPTLKRNWVTDLAALVAVGLDLDAHVLPVLEAWATEDYPVDRLTDLQIDAEEVRRVKWAHDPGNEFRIPADMPWSDELGDMVELFQRAGWRPSEHADLFAQCVRLVEDDLRCFDELDQAVELMLHAGGTPIAPLSADDLIDRYQATQAAVEHPGWSFDTFASEVSRFPTITLNQHFRRRWESGCASMADAGLDFERDVLASIAYRASWGEGSSLRDGYDVEYFADSLRDLRWLRNSEDPFRIPDDLPITKYTRRAYDLFQLAGWRPTEHPEIFATYNDRFRREPFTNCWHTIEFVIATDALRDDPVPMPTILATFEGNREKILAWCAEADFEDDPFRVTELPIDPRVEARLCSVQ
jgi:hypothetical protein